MTEITHTMDSEIYVLVDDISWLHEQEQDSGGIYRLQVKDLYEVYTSIDREKNQRPNALDHFWWVLYEGMDDRWFRLSRELYDACLKWKSQGKFVSSDWFLVQ